jgi:V/A-type H+/Na+-transporting ATPase subunit E
VTTILGDPEALVADVIRRAQHRAVEVADEARRHAASIIESAKQESETLRQQSENAMEKQVAALTRRNAARSELEAQRRLTQLREKPINRVWAGAEERLRDLVKQSSYRDVLKRCALRAARELGATDFVLAADPAGHELLSPETLDRWSKEGGVQFRRATKPATTWGGLLVTSGRLRFDATFPTQLELARVRLRENVFQILSQEKA